MLAVNADTGEPVTLRANTSGEIRVSGMGDKDDTQATTDTGTFSLVALVKRLLGKFPSLGQAVMTGSQPVVIASNQSAVPVNATAVASTVLGQDVGVQYRANATGAATVKHLVSLATTNLTPVKASAGRVLGWSFGNNTAAWVYLKLHNTAGAPTAGAGVICTIGIPPNNKSEISIPGGLSFATGIAFSTTNLAADTDTTAVAAGSIVGDLHYA